MFYNNEEENIDITKKSVTTQAGEINSLVEYVVEDCLDIKDTTPEDEDDDWSDPFKTEKTGGKWTPESLAYEYSLPISFIEKPAYSAYYNSTFNKIFLEIKSPPPKQA